MWNKLDSILDKADAVLITSAHNIRYFSGFSGGEGICIIGKDFRYLLVDSRYTIAAKLEATDFEVIEFGAGKLMDEVSSKISKHSIEKIAFENSDLTVDRFDLYKEKLSKIEFIGVSFELSNLRAVKTAEEIALIKKAESIGDIAFEKVLPILKIGVCENDIAAELEYQMRKNGASGTSFETIAVSGAKSGMPHGKPDSKRLECGDFLTMDFGCIYGGYCSDMTRTVVIGKASDEHKKIYNTVLEAQIAGLDAICEGITGKEADLVARSIIDNAGYGKSFGHSLGHGVGLLIHEQPNLSPVSDTVLVENMVVTCEPGIYIEGFGGVRIEDTVVIKKNGIENLCKSPKELLICG